VQLLAARALAIVLTTFFAYLLVGRAGRRGGRLVKWVNRRVLNPIVLRIAGPLAVSVVHHVGRRTGRAYRTPVFAEPTTEGFVVALFYGAEADWCRNVLAARGATIAHRGHEFRLVSPRVIDADAARPMLPVGVGFIHRVLGTRGFLTLRHPRHETVEAPPPRAAPMSRPHRPSPRRPRVHPPTTGTPKGPKRARQPVRT
jgi:deazaflavin-dependent oxidoreductase (nitroreductase family)